VILFSAFYLAIYSASGQENALRFEVQQAKKANVYFDSIVLHNVSVDTRVFQNFIDTNEVFFLKNTFT
jgi:hypothetical protein